jgi:hypothetical protein
MKNTKDTLIENLKKQIKNRKETHNEYGYLYAIKTVADSIIPYDVSKAIKPAIIPVEFNF